MMLKSFIVPSIKWVGAFITMFLVCCTGFAQARMPSVKRDSTNNFIVVAHRGDHTKAPENTLEAYQNAINDGVDFIETDLRTTKDSQLVIMHDATVDRMTNGTGKVSEMTLEALKKLKIKNKDTNGQGQTIPTFREVLQLAAGKINVYLDFKDADALAAYGQLREFGMEKHTIVYINAEKQYTQWRLADPSMPLMLSLPTDVKDTAGLKTFLDKYKISILDGGFSQYTSDMVRYAEDNGCVVLPDIQGPNENEKLWDQAIEKGIHGLQTDHPGELVRYLQNRKLR